MTLKELYPVYPLGLRSPPKSEFKFGTRNIYVDFPYQVYDFIQLMMEKAKEVEISKEEIKREWLEFLQYNSSLQFNSKPLASIFLRENAFSQKKCFILQVKWGIFLEYLEKKAEKLALKIEEDGRNIAMTYNEIWTNFFEVRKILEPPQITKYPSALENFKKLLKRTGEYFFLTKLLNQLEEVVTQIEKKMGEEIPSVYLYTTNLKMDIHSLNTLIEIVNIPASFLFLRNILENFVKFFVYLKIGGSFNNPNLVLSALFVYEYEEVEKERQYGFKKFKKEFVRKFQKIDTDTKEIVDLREMTTKFKKKHVPTLGINTGIIKDFSSESNLSSAGLDKLYSACSEVIHNQSPLPFFSLLEVKVFKHFLKRYVNSLSLTASRLADIKGCTPEEIMTPPFSQKEKFLKKCQEAASLLTMNFVKEIEKMIKNAMTGMQEEIFIEPLTLVSIFHLLSPSTSHRRDYSFIEEDLAEVIKRLDPLSFRIGLREEVEGTLEKLGEIIIPKLEKYEIFSSLKSEEEKKKVVFYLLLDYLTSLTIKKLKSEI